MAVVRDRGHNADERHRALLALSMLDRHLAARPCLNELAELYGSCSRLEKQAILLCFKASEDPHGIPVFVSVLDKEQDLKLRLSAAAALAQWNVRRGVAELVDLLESEDPVPQPSRIFYVRESALDLLRTKSELKGWGLRAEEIWKPIEARTDLDGGQKAALYFSEAKAEAKKWFAENEHRFPEWNPGDPLPEPPQRLEQHEGNNGKE